MALSQTDGLATGRPPRARIVILGGGFGGVTAARHLERLCKRRPGVEIVLVSRDNFLLMTPLLFEVCSGHSTPATAPSRSVRSCGLRASSKPWSRASIWSAAWFTCPPG